MKSSQNRMFFERKYFDHYPCDVAQNSDGVEGAPRAFRIRFAQRASPIFEFRFDIGLRLPISGGFGD